MLPRDGSRWFGGVTCSDGAGSSRAGEFADFDDQEMRRVRRIEQRSAASAGNYGAMIQLDYPGSMIRNPSDSALVNDLREIPMATLPGVVYTHNPADKHGTHLAVAVASLRAMRTLPPKDRPARVIGCEVWCDLDWLPDMEKVIMNVSGGDHLPGTLNACFQSQIAGGKV